MNSLKSVTALMKMSIKSLAFILLFVQCTEHDVLPTAAPAEDIAQTASLPQVASVSISGLFTEFTNESECAACSVTIDGNVREIDGAALGIKPGDVVCLKENGSYKELNFINMFGTAEKPIVISYCKKQD